MDKQFLGRPRDSSMPVNEPTHPYRKPKLRSPLISAEVCASCAPGPPGRSGRGPAAAPRADENPADERRAYRDVDDDLPVFCPECAEREFGD